MEGSSSSSFYVTLLSVNDQREFPNNTAVRFKARLPTPLPDDAEGWEVGLAGVFIPAESSSSSSSSSADSQTPAKSPTLLALTAGLAPQDVLFHLYATTETGQLSGTVDDDIVDLTVAQIRAWTAASTGVAWLHRVIDHLTQTALSKIPPGKRWWENGKKTTQTFRWEGDDLVVDNKDTMLAWNKYPYFSVHVTVALRMGWIHRTSDGQGYRLGPHLLMELLDPQAKLPDPSNDHIWGSLGFAFSRNNPMVVHGDKVYLCNVFNWRFVRLNDAFTAWTPSSIPSETEKKKKKERAVFVYSDVVRSNLVGDTLTDLLRIVPYKGVAQWWEPRHIEFHPLRGPSITIVEVNLAWSNGQLLDLPAQSASHCRLWFRRRRNSA